MNDYFKILEPYISIIFFAFISVLALYIRSFAQESGKIAALKNENKKLVEETEIIKKEHHLDISKRKYQYESKKEQYLIFYKLIDSFTTESNKSMQVKLTIILKKFYDDFLESSSSLDETGMNRAASIMASEMQEISFSIMAEFTRIKQETNTIRIIASTEILEKLNHLESSYEDLTNKSNEMMACLPQLINDDNQIEINKLQTEIELIGLKSKSINGDIIELMRKELNEI